MFIPNMTNHKTRNNVLKELLNCDKGFGFSQVFVKLVKAGDPQKCTKRINR